MSIEVIVPTVILVIMAIIALIVTIIKKGKRKKCVELTTTEKPFLQEFRDTFMSLIDNVSSAEELFNSISTGKTGTLKLKDVLNNIKVDCLTKGEEYNEEYWKEIIQRLINCTKTVNSR